MLRKVKTSCNFLLNKINLAVAFAFCALTLLTTSAFAQTTSQVSVTKPSISWGSAATDLVQVLTEVAVVGIGIGVSIWAIMMVARLFKRSAT